MVWRLWKSLVRVTLSGLMRHLHPSNHSDCDIRVAVCPNRYMPIQFGEAEEGLVIHLEVGI